MDVGTLDILETIGIGLKEIYLLFPSKVATNGLLCKVAAKEQVFSPASPSTNMQNQGNLKFDLCALSTESNAIECFTRSEKTNTLLWTTAVVSWSR